jgi:hypothetical protein
MISLHVVSGPWTSFVVAIDKGRFNIAVCRRYSDSKTKKSHAAEQLTLCKIVVKKTVLVMG